MNKTTAVYFVQRRVNLWIVLIIAPLTFVLSGQPTPAAESDLRLSLDTLPAGLRLSWPATIKSNGATLRLHYEVQRSLDWREWRPIGERQRASSDDPPERLSLDLATDAPQAFYRLLAVNPRLETGLASNGAEVFGYGEAFTRELERVGQISPAEFGALFPHGANYSSSLSWNPITGQFWEQFNADPSEINQDKEPGQPGYRTVDFRLSPAEFAVFQTNGFVVSERLGAQSFAEVFYDLWRNDLPVFISTDALLQAWHRSYDGMLEEIEETYLCNSVGRMLDGMAAEVEHVATGPVEPTLRLSLQDADFLLTVARSLWRGTNVSSVLGQDARVSEMLADIQAEQLKNVPDFMGFCRTVDFSQFKVRGHYTHSERLGRYFKTIMWLGRIDLPVAGAFDRCSDNLPDPREASPRELGAAIVLWHLLKASGEFDQWANMERIINAFVGWTDSLNFAQLNGLLAGAGVHTLWDVPGVATLEQIQRSFVAGQLGVQNIRSDWFIATLGADGRYALPKTFTVIGQKFIPDSWALSQIVFDGVEDQRRVPGALDVAFSVLRNDQVVPDLVRQMNGTFLDPDRPRASDFRDGFPYQQNLTAVRRVLDSQSPEIWESNLYLHWLATLRELSVPTTAPVFPDVMRTPAWAMKTLNTQLASWTHLRHDTILYAKQSYTRPVSCVYPKGYVEPRSEFWRRLRQMAERTADQISRLALDGVYPYLDSDGLPVEIALSGIQGRQVEHLINFAAVAARLETLANKELAQECFSREDELFIDSLMENRVTVGCDGVDTYSGWYPGLFYRAIYWDERRFHRFFGAGAFDALVADVHTDVASPTLGDPGSVLHEAVGRVNLLMMAVDHGGERFVCAGPVLSHYEFEVLGDPRRLNDDEWQRIHSQGIFPANVPPSRFEGLAPPVWTQSYLVRRP